jgi:hypothetical protein
MYQITPSIMNSGFMPPDRLRCSPPYCKQSRGLRGHIAQASHSGVGYMDILHANFTYRLTPQQSQSSLHGKYWVFAGKTGGASRKGCVVMKENSSDTKSSLSDHEFERLLRRASESARSRRPQLLKSSGPKRSLRSNTEETRQEFDASPSN